MYIERLVLKNFRNYSNSTVNFSPGYNFLTGDNGAGKTNILESISVVSNIKSFRNCPDDDIIRWGGDFYYSSIEVSGSDHKLFEIGYTRKDGKAKKKLQIDNIEIRKATDYYGKLLSVAISPDDINLISGSPDNRRRFFDGVFSKVDHEYYKNLVLFRKTLNARNRIIRDMKDKKNDDKASMDHLETWNRLFAEYAAHLIVKRTAYSDEFSKVFGKSYYDISGGDHVPEIIYSNHIKCQDQEEIISRLKKSINRDIAIGTTSIGPQRDEYLITNDHGVNYQCFASQGQKRTASISMKSAELSFLENRVKKKQ